MSTRRPTPTTTLSRRSASATSPSAIQAGTPFGLAKAKEAGDRIPSAGRDCGWSGAAATLEKYLGGRLGHDGEPRARSLVTWFISGSVFVGTVEGTTSWATGRPTSNGVL